MTEFMCPYCSAPVSYPEGARATKHAWCGGCKRIVPVPEGGIEVPQKPGSSDEPRDALGVFKEFERSSSAANHGSDDALVYGPGDMMDGIDLNDSLYDELRPTDIIRASDIEGLEDEELPDTLATGLDLSSLEEDTGGDYGPELDLKLSELEEDEPVAETTTGSLQIDYSFQDEDEQAAVDASIGTLPEEKPEEPKAASSRLPSTSIHPVSMGRTSVQLAELVGHIENALEHARANRQEIEQIIKRLEAQRAALRTELDGLQGAGNAAHGGQDDSIEEAETHGAADVLPESDSEDLELDTNVMKELVSAAHELDALDALPGELVDDEAPDSVGVPEVTSRGEEEPELEMDPDGMALASLDDDMLEGLLEDARAHTAEPTGNHDTRTMETMLKFGQELADGSFLDDEDAGYTDKATRRDSGETLIHPDVVQDEDNPPEPPMLDSFLRFTRPQ